MTGIMTTLASGLVAAGDNGREAWVTSPDASVVMMPVIPERLMLSYVNFSPVL